MSLRKHKYDKTPYDSWILDSVAFVWKLEVVVNFYYKKYVSMLLLIKK